MSHRLIASFVFILLVCIVSGSSFTDSPCTLASAVAAAGCDTSIIVGLTTQIVKRMMLDGDGFAVILGDDIQLGSACTPFLQLSALNALHQATTQRGVPIKLNSAYRSVAQQYLLYSWYLNKQCGIPLAAVPGTSNHEGGQAVDISDNVAWNTSLTENNWQWLGPQDRVHFTYIGPGARDLRQANMMAYQRLWNSRNPNNKIAVSGVYDTDTATALAKTPCNGF